MWPFRSKQSQPPAPVASSPENPSTPLSWGPDWGGDTFAGPQVTEGSSMRSTVVFRCVSLRSGVVAGLPLQVFRRTANGRELANDHPLYPVLHDAPSDLMTAFTWKELIEVNLCLSGNHFSVIEAGSSRGSVRLYPVNPAGVHADRVRGRVRYTLNFKDGKEVLDQDQVVHVPGLGFDGIRGLSPITLAGRQAIGTALSMEEFVGRIHSNSAVPRGWIELPATITPDGLKRMREEIGALYSGASNAGRTLFLDNGSKWNALSLSMADAQTLEMRRFGVADICRLYGVPPFMAGETDKGSNWGTGLEQQRNGFLIFAIDPDLCRIEGELNRKLFAPPYYCEFNRQALNAMDAMTEADLFAKGVQNARYTPNEVRRRSNLPDLPGGDQLYIQGAMVPLTQAGLSGRNPTTGRR